MLEDEINNCVLMRVRLEAFVIVTFITTYTYLGEVVGESSPSIF